MTRRSDRFLKLNGSVVVFGVVGLILAGLGVWDYVKPSGVVVEVVRDKSGREGGGTVRDGSGTVVVDVSGAVEKPGAYEFDGAVRVGEALSVAGGLSADADRVWVARFINLAQKVGDGTKIYIPYKGEKVSDTGDGVVLGDSGGGVVLSGSGVSGFSKVSSGVVNVNSASVSELDELWGIGESRARKIIENRPYKSLDELVTKAGIPRSVLDKNDGRMGL